jgi:hypothetical protein
MPPAILTFLLRGGHLNVEERKEKGLWPSERLRYSEVVDHLASVIENEEWFPRMMPEHKPGELVYEGTVIQRISANRFVCHSCRPSVNNLRVVAEQSTHECRNARDAAAYYLKWELNLPGTLDSWIVD